MPPIIAPAAPAPAPAEPDPYEGVGGSYTLDPRTGRRVQVVAPPDQPQTAIAPAAPVQTFGRGSAAPDPDSTL